MPSDIIVSNYLSGIPNCKLAYDSDGNVVLIVNTLRTTGLPDPFSYGLQFTGLKNGDSARESQINSQITAGIFATTFVGTQKYETIFGNNIKFQSIYRTTGVTLAGMPSQNGMPGQLKVTFQVGYMIPVSGSLTIGLPIRNIQYQDLGPKPQSSMIVNVTSLNATGFYLTQSSTINLGGIKILLDLTGNTQYIKLSLNNQEIIQKGTAMTVTLQQIWMPPNLSPLEGISVSSGDKDFYEIEETYGLVLTNLQPATELSTTRISKASITTLAGILEEGQTYSFQVSIIGDLPFKSYFTLQVPDSVGVPAQPAQQMQLKCSFGCVNTQALTVAWTPSSRLLTVSSFIPSVSSYLSAPNQVIFTLSGFTNPATTDPAYFKWTSYASLPQGDFMIDQISSMYIQAQIVSCTVSSFYPTDNNYMIYGIAQSWNVTMTCSHIMRTTNGVIINLPSDFLVLQSQKCVVGGQSPTATCILSQGTITIANLVSQQIPKQQAFSFTVNAIRNPTALGQQYNLSLTTTLSSGQSIGQGSFTIIGSKMQPAKIQQFTVVPQNLAVGQYPVLYDFFIQLYGDVQKGSYFTLTLPDEVTLYQQPKLESTCSTNFTGFTNTFLTCKVSGNIITINSGFQFLPNTLFSDNLTPVNLTFTLPQFWNPRSMTYTKAFDLSVFSANNIKLYFWDKTTGLTSNGQPVKTGLSQGPVIQMQKSAVPIAINFTRSNLKNGDLSTYNFTVVPTNYLSSGDLINIQFPYPVTLSENSTCKGLSINLQSNLKYVLAVDLTSIQFTVQTATNRLLQAGPTTLGTIASNQQFMFQLTDVKNPISTTPTSQSIVYSMYSGGNLMESQPSGLIIVNTVPGNLSTALIIPNEFINNQATNYTLKFNPVNYIQNMKIVITVPDQVLFSSSNVRCLGVAGCDTQSLTCTTDLLKRTVSIDNCVAYTKGNPGSIKIIFDSLINPDQGTITETFRLQTYTDQGFILDELNEGMKINFFCEYPCASCSPEAKRQCLSCYTGADKAQLFYNYNCLSSCPDGLVTAISKSNCTTCSTNCKTCTTFATNCSSCNEGYRLYDGNNNTYCVEIVYWPFPFIFLSLILFFIVLCSECQTKGVSRFKEMLVALVSFCELGSWITFTIFSIFRTQYLSYSSLGGLIAIGLYLIINIVFAVIHSTKMLREASETYNTLATQYKHSTNCLRCMSYTMTFKFSLVLVSYFCLKPKLMGDWSPSNSCNFNSFMLAFILVPYPLMIATCSYFLYSDGLFSYAGFVAIEVIALSTFMTCLMLVDAATALSCTNKKVKINVAPKSPEKKAQAPLAAVDMDYESEDGSPGKKAKKKRRDGESQDEFGAEMEDSPLQKVDTTKNPYTEQSLILDSDDLKKRKFYGKKVDQSGMHDSNDSKNMLKPYTSQTSPITLDEESKKQLYAISEYMKQISEDKLQSENERQLLLSGHREQIELLEKYMSYQQSNVSEFNEKLKGIEEDQNEILKFVNEKITQSEDLNRQILREIYEDQLQEIKVLAKKGYRDVEGEMDADELVPLTFRSFDKKKVQDAVQMPKPVSEYEEDKWTKQLDDDGKLYYFQNIDAQFGGWRFGPQLVKVPTNNNLSKFSSDNTQRLEVGKRKEDQLKNAIENSKIERIEVKMIGDCPSDRSDVLEEGELILVLDNAIPNFDQAVEAMASQTANEQFMLRSEASYSHINLTDMKGDSVMFHLRSDAHMEINSDCESKEATHIMAFFQNENALFDQNSQHSREISTSEFNFPATTTPYFEKLQEVKLSKEGAEQQYFTKEKSAVRVSRHDYQLYGLMGQVKNVETPESQRIRPDSKQQINPLTIVDQQPLPKPSIIKQNDIEKARKKVQIQSPKESAKTSSILGAPVDLGKEVSPEISSMRSLLPLDDGPYYQNQSAKKYIDPKNEKIGLKLVDLGLGDQFDGDKQMKEKAVEWYLQKENERRLASPLINTPDKSPKSSKLEASGNQKSVSPRGGKSSVTENQNQNWNINLQQKKKDSARTVPSDNVPGQPNIIELKSKSQTNRTAVHPVTAHLQESKTSTPKKQSDNLRLNTFYSSITDQKKMVTLDVQKSPSFETEVRQQKQNYIEDDFGHSESSEGIVNHELFTVAHHFKLSDHPVNFVPLTSSEGASVTNKIQPGTQSNKNIKHGANSVPFVNSSSSVDDKTIIGLQSAKLLQKKIPYQILNQRSEETRIGAQSTKLVQFDAPDISSVTYNHPVAGFVKESDDAQILSSEKRSKSQTKQATQIFQPAVMLTRPTQKKTEILYSDRSESSVDAMMDDTPSNYNIANGRFPGKSVGIKSSAALAQVKSVGQTSNLASESLSNAAKSMDKIQQQRSRQV